ncbi:tetratricopeptide repeat protein [Sagittula sp. NFXS13]|uniref:Tetratricopeptide (TPR) repeat protein n=1 Tax=Sagittula marina TaxID=943940 RepID=A0A7W6DKW9_9RHOB|nr:tetratricopeptide repeat protein [Sagittula marina]MBB3984652.1 tetratricopeptide (TPR) repeat protein [Sagittula marina]
MPFRGPLIRAACAVSCVLALTACAEKDTRPPDSPFAPTLDPDGEAVDGLIVGHRLMEAGEYNMALESFIRAAASHGLTAEVLVALGSANLSLGRLNQSEKLLRRAIELEPDWPEAWNNLGVVVMERNKPSEAVQIFRRAYALDNGESDSIRDNLRLALAKLDNRVYDNGQQEDFKLVRRGSGSYLIRRNTE